MKTFEEIKELFPKTTSGYFIDRGDDLSEKLSEVQEAIQTQSFEPLDEIMDGWHADFDYEKSELKKDLITRLDIDEDEAEELMEEYADEINDEMHERDNSTPLSDLIRYTGEQTMFYDTGHSINDGSWNWSEKEIASERQSIKKVLGIRTYDKNINDNIDMMIRQASYGGKLVIYFYDYIDNYINIKEIEKIKYIQFENTHIAIIDVHQGSGDNCYVGGFKIKLPFKTTNIFICSTFKYSYTHSVCGMISNWCDDTKVSFETKRFRRKVSIEDSTYSNHFDKEKNFNETFKKGSCTTGDMDIKRHRNTTYINNYPCGNKCLDCGTFWID